MRDRRSGNALSRAWLSLLAAFIALVLAVPAFATSSINPALPANGQPYNSSVVRGQFDSAASDINGLQSLNIGASAPVTCNLANAGTQWINNSSAPYAYNICDGTGTWVTAGYIDPTNHIFSPNTGRGACQTITAATTTDLGSEPQSCLTVSGNSSVSITSFGSSAKAGDIKFLVFNGANTLVYNASSHSRRL
jgi:hypothetical protein